MRMKLKSLDIYFSVSCLVPGKICVELNNSKLCVVKLFKFVYWLLAPLVYPEIYFAGKIYTVYTYVAYTMTMKNYTNLISLRVFTVGASLFSDTFFFLPVFSIHFYHRAIYTKAIRTQPNYSINTIVQD